MRPASRRDTNHVICTIYLAGTISICFGGRVTRAHSVFDPLFFPMCEISEEVVVFQNVERILMYECKSQPVSKGEIVVFIVACLKGAGHMINRLRRQVHFDKWRGYCQVVGVSLRSLAKAGSCHHFRGVICPEAESIGACVAV